jgi:hypothetical protein
MVADPQPIIAQCSEKERFIASKLVATLGGNKARYVKTALSEVG